MHIKVFHNREHRQSTLRYNFWPRMKRGRWWLTRCSLKCGKVTPAICYAPIGILRHQTLKLQASMNIVD